MIVPANESSEPSGVGPAAAGSAVSDFNFVSSVVVSPAAVSSPFCSLLVGSLAFASPAAASEAGASVARDSVAAGSVTSVLARDGVVGSKTPAGSLLGRGATIDFVLSSPKPQRIDQLPSATAD